MLRTAVAERSGSVIDVAGRRSTHPSSSGGKGRGTRQGGDRRDVVRLFPLGPLLGRQGVGGIGQPGYAQAVTIAPAPPGGRAGLPREVVSLAAGIQDHDGVQFRRQRGLEPFGELDNRLVQIAAESREQLLLLHHRLHDLRMTVADHGHVVVAVEVTPVVGIEQPDTLAANQVNRF